MNGRNLKENFSKSFLSRAHSLFPLFYSAKMNEVDGKYDVHGSGKVAKGGVSGGSKKRGMKEFES